MPQPNTMQQPSPATFWDQRYAEPQVSFGTEPNVYLASQAGLFKPGQKVTIGTIPDGPSNTILVAEAAKPVIWSKPDDLAFNGKDLPALGGMFDGKCHVAACDGAVYRLRKNIDKDTLARLINPADGNVVSFEDAIDKGDK